MISMSKGLPISRNKEEKPMPISRNLSGYVLNIERMKAIEKIVLFLSFRHFYYQKITLHIIIIIVVVIMING